MLVSFPLLLLSSIFSSTVFHSSLLDSSCILLFYSLILFFWSSLLFAFSFLLFYSTLLSYSPIFLLYSPLPYSSFSFISPFSSVLLFLFYYPSSVLANLVILSPPLYAALFAILLYLTLYLYRPAYLFICYLTIRHQVDLKTFFFFFFW